MSNGDPLSIAAKAQAMTTPEQQAREMLWRMGFTAADFFSAGDVVELAEMLVQIEAAKDLLAMLHGDGGHYVLEHGFVKACADAVTKKFSLIAEHDALKAEFKSIDEMNDQLREQNTTVDEACAKLEKENDALKAELAAIKGAGEPVAWIVRRLDWPEHMVDVLKGTKPPAWADVAEPLYTRPCVPLTDEQIDSFTVAQWGKYSGAMLAAYRAFARAIESHIKGAKPWTGSNTR